jgi:hypothetical protein
MPVEIVPSPAAQTIRGAETRHETAPFHQL